MSGVRLFFFAPVQSPCFLFVCECGSGGADSRRPRKRGGGVRCGNRRRCAPQPESWWRGPRTDWRLELSFAVSRRVPPPFFLKRAAGFGRVVGLRWVWEVGRGPWPGEGTVAGEGVGVGVTKGLAGGAGGGMLLLTTSPGKASGQEQKAGCTRSAGLQGRCGQSKPPLLCAFPGPNPGCFRTGPRSLDSPHTPDPYAYLRPHLPFFLSF